MGCYNYGLIVLIEARFLNFGLWVLFCCFWFLPFYFLQFNHNDIKQ